MVIGCDTTHDNKSILRHRFPKNKETCDIWVERTGNNKLLNKTIQQIFQSYVMCDKHFDDSCKSPGFKKLIVGSIPTLNLPGKNLITIYYYKNHTSRGDTALLFVNLQNF